MICPLIPKRPNYQWHTDFKGPITVKTEENTIQSNLSFYVLVTVDSFSKFLWTKVFQNKDAEPVALWTRKLMFEEAIPEYWTSDNGGEFVNEVMQAVLQSFTDGQNCPLIKETHPRPRHPEVITN